MAHNVGFRCTQPNLQGLASEDVCTRQRAQRVIERVTFKEISRINKPGPLSTEAETEWMTLWNKNGPYQGDAPEDQRKTATERWEKWLDEHAQE